MISIRAKSFNCSKSNLSQSVTINKISLVSLAIKSIYQWILASNSGCSPWSNQG
jgi:hypothetical protein